MAGNEPELLVEPEHVLRVRDDTVLVGALDVLDVVAAEDHRKTGIHALGLQPGIADGPVGLRLRHDRGPDEQAVLEFVDEGAGFVLHALIVGVHEDVGAALHLVVDAGTALEIIAARAGAADDRAVEALGLQHADRPGHLGDGGIDLRLALGVVVDMLRRALIGLQAGEGQPGRRGDLPGKRHDRLSPGDAASARTAVDLD